MHPPLVIVELLLHEEQVGFELVPLEDDVAHLLLGEARLVGILVVAGWLGRRLGGFTMLAGLMARERETQGPSDKTQAGPEVVWVSV